MHIYATRVLRHNNRNPSAFNLLLHKKKNIRENYGGKKCSYCQKMFNCHKNNTKITKTTFEIMTEMNRENLIVTTNRQKMMREKKLVCITTICVTKTKSRINKTTAKKLAIMSKNKMVYRVRF